MKKTILPALAMGALSCALFSQQAQAAQMTGEIHLGGDAGNGVVNNSGTEQGLGNGNVDNGSFVFRNNSSAGQVSYYGNLVFYDYSSAGGADIESDGGVGFSDYSTAGNASIFAPSGSGGISFSDYSTAAHASLSASDTANIGFWDNSSLADCRIDAYKIYTGPSVTGGTASITVYQNESWEGFLDVGGDLTIGSLEGNGDVDLYGNRLTVGSNNLSTAYGILGDLPTGVISGTGGLTKIGLGKLTLNSANSYVGDTRIKGGVLQLDGSVAGDVVILAQGRLAGTGTIGGLVVNSGIIKPGDNASEVVGAGTPGTLTISKSIDFRPLSTYKCILKRGNPSIASKIVAFGVNIGNNVPFSFSDLGTGNLAIGTVFTVIDNTSNLAISGRFSNVSNGIIFRSKGTNFQVSYKGGTGNDLTLTVVP